MLRLLERALRKIPALPCVIRFFHKTLSEHLWKKSMKLAGSSRFTGPAACKAHCRPGENHKLPTPVGDASPAGVGSLRAPGERTFDRVKVLNAPGSGAKSYRDKTLFKDFVGDKYHAVFFGESPHSVSAAVCAGLLPDSPGLPGEAKGLRGASGGRFAAGQTPLQAPQSAQQPQC